jgi:hypothetical protein
MQNRVSKIGCFVRHWENVSFAIIVLMKIAKVSVSSKE